MYIGEVVAKKSATERLQNADIAYLQITSDFFDMAKYEAQQWNDSYQLSIICVNDLNL